MKRVSLLDSHKVVRSAFGQSLRLEQDFLVLRPLYYIILK